MKAADILQEQQRNAALAGELDEMSALLRAFGEQHAVIGEDRDRHAPDMRKAADERAAIVLLEFVKLAAIDQPRDHLFDIIGRAHIVGDDGVKVISVEFGRARVFEGDIFRSARVCAKLADDIAHDGKRVFVIFGEVIDHARFSRVQITAAQILGSDLLARRSLYQRRSGEEDRALIADNHRLVRHGGHVSAACGAAAHHTGDLRDAERRHVRLVKEDAAKVITVGKDLRLMRQVRAAAIDEVDARQAVLLRDFLRAQVLS
jgi:hypothetical protein